MARWFRFYDEALDDPKVQRLSDSLYRRWTDMLCIASRNGGRITSDIDALAFMIRQTPAKTRAAVDALVTAGLLDCGRDDYTPHAWQKRQYESDSSAERMRRHRERKRDAEVTADVASQPVTSDAAEQKQSRTDTDAADVSARDPKREVLEAMGVWDDGRWVGNAARVDAWLSQGLNLDADILPAIKAVMARRGHDPPKSLSYFDQPIADWKANRLRPMPTGKTNGAQGNRPDRPDRTAKLREAVARTFSDVAGESQAD